MTSLRYLPPFAVMVSIWRLLSGCVSFPKDCVGKVLTMDDGETQTVFREMRMTSSRSVPVDSMTVLKVRFKFSRFSNAANQRLSIIPIPVIAGMPGFRQKTWTLCEESDYSQGIYQFESVEQAHEYRNSPIMRILERRSLPETFSHELLPGTLIGDYLKSFDSVETAKG